MPKIQLSGRLLCSSMAEVAVVQAALPAHIRLTLAEAGCLSFKVWQSDDPLIWRVEELFASAADFETHQIRTRASVWWAATATIPRDYSVTEID